jgi:hypothetical protein
VGDRTQREILSSVTEEEQKILENSVKKPRTRAFWPSISSWNRWANHCGIGEKWQQGENCIENAMVPRTHAYSLNRESRDYVFYVSPYEFKNSMKRSHRGPISFTQWIVKATFPGLELPPSVECADRFPSLGLCIWHDWTQDGPWDSDMDMKYAARLGNKKCHNPLYLDRKLSLVIS